MKGILLKDLRNSYGKYYKGDECIIKDVWLNEIANKIYCQVEIKGKLLITSMHNIKYKEEDKI